MKKMMKNYWIAVVSMLMIGCGGSEEAGEPVPDDSGGGKGVLTATVYPAVIKADGEDTARIEVLFNGVPVDIDEVTFYDDATNTDLGWTTFSYRTTTPGVVTFWVSYRTYNTKGRPLSIRAAADLVPEHIEDPSPERTDFVHRSLLIDFTSVQCGYCPLMAAAMNRIGESEEYGDKVVLTALHCSGMGPDPFVAVGADEFEAALRITGYPCMMTDLRYKLQGTYGVEQNVAIIESYVDEMMREPARAGISATVHENGLQAGVLATVKASVAGRYRVGAFLLEEGLSARQNNYEPTLEGDYNTHNHVVRIIDCRASSSDYTGHDVGELEAGATAEYLFTWELERTWRLSNCSVVVFVSAQTERGEWYVTNTIHVDTMNGSRAFEYE